MKSMPLTEALKKTNVGKAVIVDIRENAEFIEQNLEGSVNLPMSEFNLDQYEPFIGKEIVLMCRSGNRVRNVYNRLEDKGIENVFISDTHIIHLDQLHLQKNEVGWTVDRQFRMTLGVLLLLFLIGYFSGAIWVIAIPVILCTGLIFTSIIDKCYMRIGISLLPWNKNKTS